MGRSLALAVLIAACSSSKAPPPSVLDRPVADWKLSRAEWNATVVEPYRQVYDDYVRLFDAAVPALSAQVATKGTIATRSHYAGDPDLTRGQARTRWALPVQFAATVASIDGAPIDAVFVEIGGALKAIVGTDQIVIEKTRALDERCAVYLETLGSKDCQTVGWELADAALRGDKARLAHACSLAATQCTR